MKVAIIGGTGVYNADWLTDREQMTVATVYGQARLIRGRFADHEVFFLSRHGSGHVTPPHKINYRANIRALHELGIKKVIATAAVGSLRRELEPGHWVVIDQFIDFTKSRVQTFYDGDGQGVVHVDVTEPYCPDLRATLKEQAEQIGVRIHEDGTYVCTEGPRFETPAEIRLFAQLGGSVVGMTGVPEVVLARELGMCYAALAMVTNFAAGISPTPLTHREVAEVMENNSSNLHVLLQNVLTRIEEKGNCSCGVLPEVYGI